MTHINEHELEEEQRISYFESFTIPNMRGLYECLTRAMPFISNGWKNTYGAFLQEEHRRRFAKKLSGYLKNGIPETLPEPHFNEDLTPLMHDSWGYFKTIVEAVVHEEENVELRMAKVMETTPFAHSLLLIGQRLTSASAQDEQAIPPLEEKLIRSCFEPFNEQTSVAARAWEKHVGRSTDPFWGVVSGNSDQKEKRVRTLVTDMLHNVTWWNVFYHYKHELVYEIRVSSGHGIRWTRNGETLIGFLEPFL